MITEYNIKPHQVRDYEHAGWIIHEYKVFDAQGTLKKKLKATRSEPEPERGKIEEGHEH